VTAHDIAFSIALWRHPDVQWYGAAAVDSAHAVDDHTVVFFYRRPGTTADLTWDVYYPKHLLEDLDPARFFEWEFWTRPIGNGPYRYVRHDPGTHFELAANPDYYRGEPAIQRVRIRLGSDESHRLNLLAGRVDITRLTSGTAERFLRDDRFAVYYDRTSFAPIRLAWNVRHPLFAEKAIRQALTFGIDRRELAAALGIVEAAPVTDGILSGCLAERGELRSPRPYDPARAERILEAAGWRDSDAAAVRDKEGVPFRFETIVPVNQEPAAVLVQQQLRRIGVAMELRVMEPTIVNRRFNAGEFEAAVPTLARFDRWIALPHPSSDARTPGNGYDNSRARELWETVARTDSVDELLRVQRELSAIYHEEIPGTFLYARIHATVARSRVHGLDVTPNWLAFPDRLSIAAAR
jgi:peptide/nickel transport system substrate-binding protein